MSDDEPHWYLLGLYANEAHGAHWVEIEMATDDGRTRTLYVYDNRVQEAPPNGRVVSWRHDVTPRT